MCAPTAPKTWHGFMATNASLKVSCEAVSVLQWRLAVLNEEYQRQHDIPRQHIVEEALTHLRSVGQCLQRLDRDAKCLPPPSIYELADLG